MPGNMWTNKLVRAVFTLNASNREGNRELVRAGHGEDANREEEIVPGT